MVPLNRKPRVAVLGSAFDPVHYAHLAMGVAVHSLGLADDVWLLPSPSRWDKQPVATAAQRVLWLRAAADHLISEGVRCQVREDEIEAGVFRGTYVTMSALARTFPQFDFSLVLGADAAASVATWRDAVTGELNGERLKAEVPFLVFPRPMSGETADTTWRESLALPSTTRFCPSLSQLAEAFSGILPVENLDALSSSRIRAQLARSPGKCELDFIYPEVQALIELENPYFKN